jgi:hypothetical protein
MYAFGKLGCSSSSNIRPYCEMSILTITNGPTCHPLLFFPSFPLPLSYLNFFCSLTTHRRRARHRAAHAIDGQRGAARGSLGRRAAGPEARPRAGKWPTRRQGTNQGDGRAHLALARQLVVALVLGGGQAFLLFFGPSILNRQAVNSMMES